MKGLGRLFWRATSFMFANGSENPDAVMVEGHS